MSSVWRSCFIARSTETGSKKLRTTLRSWSVRPDDEALNPRVRRGETLFSPTRPSSMTRFYFFIIFHILAHTYSVLLGIAAWRSQGAVVLLPSGWTLSGIATLTAERNLLREGMSKYLWCLAYEVKRGPHRSINPGCGSISIR